MKTTRIIALAVLIVGSGLALHVARAQQPGIKRTDLQRHNLSVPGREVVQVRVDFAPGVAFGKHSHPSEEIVYVLEGLLEYQVEGKPPATLKAGDALFIPAGTIHSARNVGSGNGAELATCISSRKGSRSSRWSNERQGGDPTRCRGISSVLRRGWPITAWSPA
jgi:quercetin dioxygenase-like cupin family protein